MRSGEAPVSTTLPLLCALGRHRTDGLARWNAGYYFARCTRCRRDLVRTAFTRWQIPKGFRVVWQDETGFARQPAPEPARQSVPQGQVEFPIREEARFVDAGPVHAEPAEQSARGVADEDVYDPDPRETASEEDGEARASAAEVPLAEILRGVQGLADEAPPQSDADDAADEPGVRFEGDEERFEEEDVRFEPSDRLIDFASAGQADSDATVAEPEALVTEPAAPEETVPDVVATPAPAPAVRSKYPVVPDFMDESAGGVGWEAVSGRIVPSVAPSPTPVDDTPDVPTGLLSKGWRDLIRGAQGLGSAAWLGGERASEPAAPVVAQPHQSDEIDRPQEAETEIERREETMRAIAADPEPQVAVADAPPVAVGEVRRLVAVGHGSGRFEHFLMNQSAIVAATIFGGLVLAASMIDSRNVDTRAAYSAAQPASDAAVTQAPVAPRTRAPVARTILTTPRAQFVTASLLMCRSMPDNNADTLRRLERGARVEVLGVRPGWSSIAHQGRQCWVATQHLSVTRPV